MRTHLKSGLAGLAFLGLLACSDDAPIIEENAAPRLDHIAFGSCVAQTLPQPFWPVIAGENPDLFIFGGDNVYGDLAMVDGQPTIGKGDPALLSAAYKMLDSNPEFSAFREQVTILPVWDDHDFGENDAGASYAHKVDSETQFLDFWNIKADDPRRARPGIYTSSIQGRVGERVQIIMLDTRYFRSDLVKNTVGEPGTQHLNLPSEDPSTTVLGDAQWAWLAEELKKEADVRLIVSSIQVHAEGHGYERWGNFPHERSRLYDLIAETRANGVIFLSGDRHSGALYVKHSEDHYPLFEMTSSSLNRPYPNPDETGPYQLGSLYGEVNYATITFDWENRAVVLQIKDMDGQPVRSAGLEIDGLR